MPWTKVAVDHACQSLAREVEIQGGGGRMLSYRDAVREALSQALARDSRVVVMGEGVDDPGGIFGTTLNLHREFDGRVFDVPLAENGLTGVAIGMALSGTRPVLVHMRMDFVVLSLDQILNHAAKISYMSGGRSCVPLVIRVIIGRGYGSAAQHSQALHALFAHMPGIKIVMPSNAYDAKGLLLSAIADQNPVICVEHRWLYDIKAAVPQEEFLIPIGKGFLRKSGRDVTVVAVSWMVAEALRAQEKLSGEGVDLEIIDPRSLNPFDEQIIIDSVAKTGRLVIVDLGWQTQGWAQGVAGRLFNKIRGFLKSDIRIVALPDCPTPASSALEKIFYKDADDIASAARETMRCPTDN